LGLVGSLVAVIAAILVAVLVAILFGFLGLGELVALTVFSVAVAVIVFGFLLVVVIAYAAQAAVGLAVAGLALRPMTGARRWGLLALGVLAVVVVTSIPVVGGWLALLVVLFGLGAFLLAVNARRRGAALPSGP
jgi:hypothetical protein